MFKGPKLGSGSNYKEGWDRSWNNATPKPSSLIMALHWDLLKRDPLLCSSCSHLRVTAVICCLATQQLWYYIQCMPSILPSPEARTPLLWSIFSWIPWAILWRSYGLSSPTPMSEHRSKSTWTPLSWTAMALMLTCDPEGPPVQWEHVRWTDVHVTATVTQVSCVSNRRGLGTWNTFSPWKWCTKGWLDFYSMIGSGQ